MQQNVAIQVRGGDSPLYVTNGMLEDVQGSQQMVGPPDDEPGRGSTCQ
jgi:hypothetical protein